MRANVHVSGLDVERRHEVPAGRVPQERVEVRTELAFPLQEALRDHGFEAFDIEVAAAIYERLQLVLPLLGHFLRESHSLKD